VEVLGQVSAPVESVVMACDLTLDRLSNAVEVVSDVAPQV
jgi:hypothetical protein